jgi:hypothetical protein
MDAISPVGAARECGGVIVSVSIKRWNRPFSVMATYQKMHIFLMKSPFYGAWRVKCILFDFMKNCLYPQLNKAFSAIAVTVAWGFQCA